MVYVFTVPSLRFLMLSSIVEESFDPSVGYQNDCEGYVIDLSVIVRSQAAIAVSQNCKTFFDFSEIVINYIEHLGQFATRLDIVADHYYPFSIKSPTRQDRGTGGSRLLFREDTPFPSDFSTDFLKNSENKEDLNMFLASAARHKSWEKLVYVTHGEGVKECTTGGDIRMYEDDGLTRLRRQITG